MVCHLVGFDYKLIWKKKDFRSKENSSVIIKIAIGKGALIIFNQKSHRNEQRDKCKNKTN